MLRSAVHGSAVSRTSLTWVLAGSSLGGSSLRRIALGGSCLGGAAGTLMERGRGSPRSGVPATIGMTADALASRVGSSATQATAQDRLGADGSVGLEPGDDLLRDRSAEHALDLAKQLQLIDTDE